MTSAFLSLRGLAKTFPGGTAAVRGVDLDVAEGEFIVLLGPSGCGKTTLLRMVAGLERPSAGRVELDGRDVTRLSPAARDVGFVFQSYALYPRMTVRANIAFPLANGGMAEADAARAAEEEARRLGLADLLDRFPGELSGGDRQRVALARALVRRPKACFMDEPLGTMDADRRQESLERIRAIAAETRVTTLYVTHDQEEAMSLADRIVVMDGGLVRQTGTPEEVYARPASLFVAGFLGSPGINVLRGHVALTPHGSAFVAEGGGAPMALNQLHAPGPALLGVRPEDMKLDPDGHVVGELSQAEFLGTHRLFHVRAPAGRIVVRAAAAAAVPSAGGTVRLSFDPARAALFDPASGARLA
jgi:ABC-type sugar transport system ATPase subunit